MYREFYVVGAASHSLVSRLNCRSVSALRPGQRVQYAMEMPITAGSGAAKFGWQLPAAVINLGNVVDLGG